VIKLLQILIAYGLSLLFLSAIVHYDTNHHQNHDEYSICNIDCENQNHHSISHQCEKCLNKNQRFYDLTKIDFSSDEKAGNYFASNDIVYFKSIIYDLHNHPPPAVS